MTTIATVGPVSSSITTRTYDASGTAGWTANHTRTVYGVCIDASGNIYTGGNAYYSGSYINFRAYSGDGNLLWSAGENSTYLNAVAIHPDGIVAAGNVYVGASTVNIRLYAAADGAIIWARNYLGGALLHDVTVDDDGNVYVVGERTGGITTAKYDPDGALVWSADHGLAVYGIARDPAGNIYTGGRGDSGSSNYTTRKYNSSGTLQWSLKHLPSGPSYVYAIATDNEGNVYTGGNVASSKTTQKYDTDGTFIWSANHGNTVACIAVDGDGHVYTGGDASGGYTTRAYDADGTLLWSKYHGAYISGIAARSPPKLGGVAVPLGLGLPQVGFAAIPPGLPLEWSLAAPTPSAIPVPPDLFAYSLPPQAFYRLYLAGDSTLLELPLVSFQCRRRLGDSTWIAIDAGAYDAARYAAIAARAGAELVIYAGAREASGIETAGQFIRAVMTEYRHERSAVAGTIQVTGRGLPTPFSATARTLQGVERRGQTRSGRKTARAAVDFLLRPNDTVDDGLNPVWTAGAILYFVSPVVAWMDVEEASD